MGHCIGGLLVLILMIMNQSLDIKGVILTSPLLEPDVLKN
jgi:alpha-beta hydrolase superfamily lysophospholipase